MSSPSSASAPAVSCTASCPASPTPSRRPNPREPGTRGSLRFRPETGRPLSELAEVLLRGPNTMTRSERELIGAYVSALNGCQYCASSHGACAAAQLPEGMTLVEQVCGDAGNAPVSAKLAALLVTDGYYSSDTS